MRGRDLRRYKYSFQGEHIIFARRGLAIDSFPAVKDYLLTFIEKLRPRNNGEEIGRKPGSYQWYELQDNIAYHPQFVEPKIIWGELSDSAKFAYDEAGHYVEATTFILTGNHLKYLLAVLNSHAASWYFNQITTTSGVGTSRWKKYKILQLPVPALDAKEEHIINELVDKVLNSRTKQLDTAEIEAEIESRVLIAYGLSIPDCESVLTDNKLNKASKKLIIARVADLLEAKSFSI